MIGYVKIRFKPSADKVHRGFLDGGVHPDHRRQGVGIVLLEAGHARRHPAAKLVVDVHKCEHIAGVAELVCAQGFTPVRYFQRSEHSLGGRRGWGRPPS